MAAILDTMFSPTGAHSGGPQASQGCPGSGWGKDSTISRTGSTGQCSPPESVELPWAAP